MFKKPLSDLKTSAPIRGSDRRRLKQRVIDRYEITPEVGEQLVPDGMLSQKFSTHLDELGVVYLSQGGDPLWFTIGKGSDELIPTVYTLWKHPSLLPIVSTPAAVIPKLIGGADLMIPGVVQHVSTLEAGQLVAVTQYHPSISKHNPNDSNNPTLVPRIGPPLAVGRMALSSAELRSRANQDGEERKGKAVLVLHTWKDWLWDMGSGKKTDVPKPREIEVGDAEGGPVLVESDDEEEGEGGEGQAEGDENGASKPDDVPAVVEDAAPRPSEPEACPKVILTPEDVSHCLRSALLQALVTTLNSLPPSSFPILASTFWTTHILPARPAQALGTHGLADPSEIDIKQSTHKSVKVFLKACAKEGLVKLKENKGDVLISGVFPAHPAVAAHRPHKTVGAVQAKLERAEERERKEREAEEKKRGEIQVTELWKPFGSTVGLFVTAGKSSQEYYTLSDIREFFNAYISERNLVNAREQQYVNVSEDDALSGAVSVKGEERPEFLKREDALKRIKENMQSWHRIGIDGGDVVTKKGAVKPISVVVKVRQGRKAATLVTGFESFFLKADYLAEELRKVCAGSTSSKASTDMEVMVQGKQIQAVTDFLISKGVPEKWIEAEDQTKKKK
ncbi:eukaryotic translation initiation factor SUI1 family protein [Cristinia sonorae]|uniref:Eukaryotic translation initiation factor SUI1 family protein n=1 Tax=Cristinia sonorae TaxID=1940300 RepID=A0A8K0XQP5_9AGAR|nr:eukaryotic translation initiation factor SUI1 family protein [Cristinia sonorae]